MRKRSSGFTLVEIMIVVAIIGILIAIAIPGFIKARTTSQAKACQENLQKVDGAKEQWALETKAAADAEPTAADLYGATLYVKVEPKCPTGDTAYTINAISIPPACVSGIADHVLPN